MKVTILLLLVGFFSSAIGIPEQKWHTSEDGSLFYIDSQNKFNWYDAWNECARKNMSLIAIDTHYKHQQIDVLIKKLFTASPSFWLAAHDNAIDKRYEWVTSGETFTFTNWGPGEPNRLNNNEHCILIWQTTWQWYDLPCSHMGLGFICEENRFIKEKSKEIETLKRECKDNTDGKSKYKNLIMYVNSTPRFEYFYGNGTKSVN